MSVPPSIICAVPVLASLDIGRSLAFLERLGFVERWRYPDYASAARGDVELHLWLCDDPAVPKATSCYLRVTDAAALHAAFAAAGVPDAATMSPASVAADVPRMTTPETKPWGMVEFVVWDPDGNLLRFGQAA